MLTQADLLNEIANFLPERGITETTFGRLAVNDGKFVRRLRDGDNMTLATLSKAQRFIHEQRGTKPGWNAPVTADIDDAGTLTIPFQQRRLLGLERGGTVVLDAEHGKIVIRPLDTVLEGIQKTVREHIPAATGVTVDKFIRERQEEARREEREGRG